MIDKIDNSFKVGDQVLINPGQIYPGYEQMANRLDADFSKWEMNRSYKNWRTARDVPATCLNFLRDGSTCYVLIETFGDQYVIDITGITKPKIPTELLPEELFEI